MFIQTLKDVNIIFISHQVVTINKLSIRYDNRCKTRQNHSRQMNTSPFWILDFLPGIIPSPLHYLFIIITLEYILPEATCHLTEHVN